MIDPDPSMSPTGTAAQPFYEEIDRELPGMEGFTWEVSG